MTSVLHMAMSPGVGTAQHGAVRFVAVVNAAGVVLGAGDVLHHKALHVVRVFSEAVFEWSTSNLLQK